MQCRVQGRASSSSGRARCCCVATVLWCYSYCVHFCVGCCCVLGASAVQGGQAERGEREREPREPCVFIVRGWCGYVRVDYVMCSVLVVCNLWRVVTAAASPQWSELAIAPQGTGCAVLRCAALRCAARCDAPRRLLRNTAPRAGMRRAAPRRAAPAPQPCPPPRIASLARAHSTK
jgi:hypothetical protein